ncbi:Transcriptional regulator, LysR family [Pseudomonas chlororaphis subsp. aureofaciens]|nr:Transcriptional regulator, LysR family [Pseudomonas chlororaphis subsp. aureofaciens]
MNNLRRLDINLLLTLDVLLAEHNVTRAAQRLNLSQPSVSVHLAKLREIFGDPLLLPGPRGMRPTARADELREPLRRALEALELAVSPASPFDPGAAANTWSVSASDYGESTVILPALAGLRAAAPGTRLAVLELEPGRLVRQAEQGRIDLALHTSEDSPPGCVAGCCSANVMCWWAARAIHGCNDARAWRSSASWSTLWCRPMAAVFTASPTVRWARWA